MRDLSHKRVLKIAIPVVLSNATVPILGVVDTGVVGQLGTAAPIGAVGIGAIILGAIYWIFGFLRMGTVGLAAQAMGADDKVELRALLIRALLLGLGAGGAIILLQLPLFWLAFQISPASPLVESLAREYLHIRVLSAPAAIAIYGLTGWLIAQERTGAVLMLQLWMNGLNIGLDLVFVLGLGWGVTGVASATVIAELSAFALGLYLVRAVFFEKAWFNPTQVFASDRLRTMMRVNSDIMIRSILLQIGFVGFLFWGASLGDVTLAANQVLLQFLYVTSYALDGFAFAAESLVGQAVGVRAIKPLRRAVYLTSLWGSISVVIYAIAFALFGSKIIEMMSTSQAVQYSAKTYLIWMVIAPLIGVLSWMMDGIFIGATRTREMRNMMILSLLCYLIAVWVLLPSFGNHGLWAAMMIFFAMRGVTLALVYPRIERDL